MATLLLAASPTGAYGATNVPRGTGQLDSTPGPGYGEPLDCPGVFPVKITGKLSVYSTKATVEIVNILAGPEHLILQEKITTVTANTETILRLADTSFNSKVIGGQYTEPLNTVNPLNSPYRGVRNLALNGIPAGLFALNAYTRQVSVSTPPPPVDPANPANYFQNYSTGFSVNFSGLVTEFGHALFQNSAQGSLTSVNFSINPLDNSMSTNSADLRAITANRPAMTVSNLFNGNSVLNDQNDCTGSPVNSGIDLPSACFPLFNLPKEQRTLPGFTNVGSCADLFENTLSTLGSASATSTGIKSFAALAWNIDFDPHIPFLAINYSNRLFAGTLHNQFNQFQPVGSNFFRYRTGANSLEPYTRPALGFAGNVQTIALFPSEYANQPKNLWAAAYPIEPRYHEYLSVNATQYGFILLEKSSKQLQYMFTQHYSQLLPGELQVPAKLIHPPPRSITWKSAWNMGLGVLPGGSGAATASTLYKTYANLPAFVADNHIHGGGGHLVALGTFNGILVHNRKISVWGSNRWGQCVLPAVLQEYQSNSSNDFIDVAAAISPPLLSSTEGFPTFAGNEEKMEAAAREYFNIPGEVFAPGHPFNYGAYPPNIDITVRYCAHINYYNIPGHVCVVTSTGRVYCWGNDLYHQCKVPTDIALVNAAGQIQTTPPTDPVEEVACGSFHTVARTKSGAIYVWGAGSKAFSNTGYILNSAGHPVSYQDTAPYSVSTSVHFGQACLSGESQSGILYTPIDNPLGIGLNDEWVYTPNTAYTGTITNVFSVNNVLVGQKTASGFSVATPTGKRLKGMISAGAFHTAVIDSKFKIQCIGAGRGNYSQTDRGTIYRNFDAASEFSEPEVTSDEQNSMWGSGIHHAVNFFPTYPHYCQSLSSYSAPIEPIQSLDPEEDYFRVHLFRWSGGAGSKHRPFQDLQFKKVVCGPFSTHGIVYSISRYNFPGSDPYSIAEKVDAHGRVVSWGRVAPSEICKSSIGPLGIRNFPFIQGTYEDRIDPKVNPCINLNGTGNPKYLVGTELPDGSVGQESNATPRHFSLLNRNANFTGAIALIPPNDAINTFGTSSANFRVAYAARVPVSISKFKVKDLAVGMDFAGYIGYFNTFQITDRLDYPALANDPNGNGTMAGTFDYEASLFFSGGVIEWLPHTFSPYSGFYFVKRNKIGFDPTPGNSGSYYADEFEGNTALKVKTRSYYYGAIKPASGATVAIGGSAGVNYVVPSTLQISSSGAVLVVNADNRPVAWNTVLRDYPITSDNILFNKPVNKERILDLSLLPSIPFNSIKTGKAHAVGVVSSDWPIAIGLTSTANIPDICSSLGSILSTSITGPTYTPTVLTSNTKTKQSILWSWGAGDGREYGTGLLSAGPTKGYFLQGAGTGKKSGIDLIDFDPYGGGATFGSNMKNVYGMWFMDTHAMARYDESLSGTPTGYATPATSNNGEPTAIVRNYKKLSDTAGMIPEVNYYGEYRWINHSDIDTSYTNLADFQTYVFNGSDLFNPDSHLVESLQAKFNFNIFNYPILEVSKGLTSSDLLNGTKTALIPVAFGMPWIHGNDLDSLTDELKKCCTTAAEATAGNQQLNHLQEWHGPLSLEVQNEVDYIVDYDAGAQTTGVLFVSTADYPQIETDAHLTSKTNYLSYFTNSTNGLLRRFDKRRVCKAAITGYGCENQTAGAERKLQDNSVAPVIPQLFARNAKIRCGNSYTVVTDPVRVHTFTAPAQTLNFTGGATKTFTFNVPSNKYASRIRGIDVRLTLTCTGASNSDTPVPLNNWVVKIPYKNTEWNVLSTFQRWDNATATPVTIQGTNLFNASVLSSTYVFSDRYSFDKAYQYSNEGLTYSEAGLALASVTVDGNFYPVDLNAYLGTALYPIPPGSTAITSTNYKRGCYAPYSYDGTNRATINAWRYVDTSLAAQPFLRFDEPTIQLQVINSGAITNYANLTLSVELIVEVDAGPYPLAVYGRKRSGIWNNAFGEGPTYQADYFAFDVNNSSSREELEAACPCLLDSTLNEIQGGRYRPVSFPKDSGFICGTLKYGPSGNPEIAANLLTTPISEPPYLGLDANKILKLATSNFTAVFSKLRNRPVLEDLALESTVGPTLYSLPTSVFIITSTPIDLGVPPVPNVLMKLNTPVAAPTINRNLSALAFNACKLDTQPADLQRAILGIIEFNCKLSTNAPSVNLYTLNLSHCLP